MKLSDIFELYTKGQVDEALSAVKSAVTRNPSNPDAYHLFGIMLAGTNKHEQAIKALHRANQLSPKNPEILFNLGNCLMNSGHFEKALDVFTRSISLNDSQANIHNNLGNCYEKLNELPLAINSYRNAINCDPKYLNAILNLSRVLFNLSDYEASLEMLNLALTQDPLNFEALNRRGLCFLALDKEVEAEADFEEAIRLRPNAQAAYLHLGNLKLSQKKYAEAINLYIQCLNIDANNYDAISNIAVTLNGLKDYPRALDCINDAIRLSPQNPLLLTNRGVILKKLRRFDEAVIDLISAIELNPQYLDAYVNLGGALLLNGKEEEAKISYLHALSMDPLCASALFNLGIISLKKGEFKGGWAGYEYRWKIDDFPSNPLSTTLPTWTAEQQDERLLIWGEQGIGDEIMFSRQLTLAQKLSKNITVYTNKKLVSIFSRSYPNLTFIPYGSVINDLDFDCQLPIGSLGLHLNSNKESLSKIPEKTLQPDLDLADKIRKHLKQPNKLICGISWKSANFDLGKERSIDLQLLARALYTQNLTLVNLQYGSVHQEIAELKKQSGIEIHEAQDLDIFNNLDHLASMIEACDLVISIDNSTIHMAGAIGKKTWVLLPKIADWRWGENLSRSYWYPTLKLFRQTTQNNWQDTLFDIHNEIKKIGN